MSLREFHQAPVAPIGRRPGRRYRSGIRPLEDRVSLSASPWSQVDAEEVAALLAGKQFVANELVVAVKSTGTTATFQDILTLEGAYDAATAAAIQGATLLGSSLSDAATQIYQVTVQTGVDLTGVIAAVSQWSSVEWAAPNFVYTHPAQELAPNDPNYGSQWHHAKMQTPAAWDITQGSGVIVAVMDDGVDWDHVDLAANIWNNSDEIAGNGVDDDANGFIDDVRGWDFSSGDNNPDHVGAAGHGTHVAGIIAARTNNAQGVAGVAGRATIMPVRFFGSGAWTSTVIFNSYKYAVDNGAKIINTSYEIDEFVGDAMFEAALDYAYTRGVLIFNSAGNNGRQDPPRVVFDQIIFVGSTDQSDGRSSFSNFGSGIDVSAPGANIYSTLPNNTYGVLSGTSMASPAAAAVAALIWAANPTWTRDQVAARMLATADPIDQFSPGYEGQLGSGRVDAYGALTDPFTPPQITGVVELADTTFQTLTKLTVNLVDRLSAASAETMANWELRGDGADNTFDTADDVLINLTKLNNYKLGTNFLEFAFSALLRDRYRFTAKSGPTGLKDAFGNQLDGDANGTAGGNYVRTFTVIGDLVAETNRTTHVFDPLRNRLYIAMTDGRIIGYDLTSRTVVKTWNTGGPVRGMDVSPDGRYLFAVDGTANTTQGHVRKIDLLSDALTSISFTKTAEAAGGGDLVVDAYGHVYFTTGYNTFVLRRLKISDNSLVQLKTGSQTDMQLAIGADGRFILETQLFAANGPKFVIDASSGATLATSTSIGYLDSSMSAVNRNGTLFAIEESGTTTRIRNASLAVVKTFNFYGGVIFDPLLDVVYGVNHWANRLDAYDTNSWTLLYSISVGEEIIDSYPFADGEMSISDDGRTLAFSTPMGIRIFHLGDRPGIPTITAIADQTIDEDGTTAVLAFHVDDLDTAVGSLSITATADDPALVPNSPSNLSLTNLGGGNFQLRVTPAANRYGSTLVTVTAGDGAGVAQARFTLTVRPINDAPSFTKGANIVAAADSSPKSFANWATQISPGPFEAGQGLTFLVSNDNNGLFSVQPAISASGTLSFTSAVGATGTAVVTVRLKDDGGTGSGGIDASAAQTFLITLAGIPTISPIADRSILEDQSATGIMFSVNDADTPSASVVVTVTSSNTPLLPDNRLTLTDLGSGNYGLSLSPSANVSGETIVTVTARDGINTVTRTFRLTVTAVNDAPTFSLAGSALTTSAGGSVNTVSGWATGISAGPANEAGQSLSFLITTDRPDLFAAGPAINAAGNLTFTPTAIVGTATVNVRARDNGGAADGGVDTSLARTFTITTKALPTISPIADQSIPVNGELRYDFSVADADTPVGNLALTVSGSNSTLFPSHNLGLSSRGGGNFTVIAQPAAGLTGEALITITVRDDQQIDVTRTFRLTVAPGAPPAISPIGDATILEEVSLNLNFAVTDVDTPAAGVTVTVDSSNTTLLPAGRITLTNNGGGNYGLGLSPAADRSGETTITITAGDVGNTVTRTFKFTVTPVNDAPTFTLPITSLTLAADGAAKSYAGSATGMSAGPADESGQSLTFLVTTDRPDLFTVGPAINAAGTLTFTPSALAGTATVTVRLQDNGGTTDGGVDMSAPRTFTITTLALPTVLPIADQAIATGGELRLDFSVADQDTPAGNLAVTTASSNAALLPNSQMALAYRGGGDYTLIAQPLAGQTGDAFITITVRDAQHVVNHTFKLTVSNVAPPTPARVLGVYARGTTWSGAFTTHLQAQGMSDAAGWLELSRAAGQTDTLPWANVNELRLQFADLAALAAGDVQIVAPSGVSLPDYTVDFDFETQTALITFDQALPIGKFLIWIDDVIGNFDGEWTDNVSTASGNGTVGGDFEFRFNVLPGDIDRSQSVSFGEIGQQRQMLGRTTAAGDYNYRQDYDGSGSITFGDAGLARGNLGQGLGSYADPVAPAGESFGPESFGPESADPESFESESPTIASSDPREVLEPPVVDPAVPFTVSTLDVDSPVSPGQVPAMENVLPIMVPTGRPALGEATLARAWNGLASLPVSSVLGSRPIAAPAAIRVLAAEMRFTTLGESSSVTSSTVRMRAIVDPTQPLSVQARWNRLRCPAAAGQVSDLAVTADGATGVE